MALIKTGPSITEIKGKIGGTVFKRDSSGQHAVAYPRRPNKIATAKGKLSRSWYAGKKREEAVGGPFIPPFEWPKQPTTGIVFSLEVLWAHRQPSLTQPNYQQVEYSGFYQDRIIEWIQQNWNPAWSEWGLTKELMKLMMIKWFYVYTYTYQLTKDTALAFAKLAMQNWISQAAASVAVPALSLWLGITALSFFFAILEWLEGLTADISFTKGRVLIWQNGQLWWGGLMARPTQKMYEFWKCRLTEFFSYQWRVTPGDIWAKIVWLHLQELYQTVSPGLLIWYVYTWKTIKCRFRGYCYTVGPRVVRMECEPNQQEYWDKPIGWYQTVIPVCEYLDIWNDYWQWPGHPKPPL